MIMICAGGTMGHISPALQVAFYFYQKKEPILFLTLEKDLSRQEIQACPFFEKKIGIKAYGLSKNPKIFFDHWHKNQESKKEINKILKENKIDVFLGFGGFLSGLASIECNKRKIPVFLQEQNMVMGNANRLGTFFCKAVFTSFQETSGRHHLYVGNPSEYESRKRLGLVTKKKNQILIVGGSLGSKKLNDVICEMVSSINKKKEESSVHFTLITGDRYFEEIYHKWNHLTELEIIPYSYSLKEKMSEASFVICRGGASTLFELIGLQTPALVIPLQNSFRNHQKKNAKWFEKKGFGLCLEEKKLSCETLYQTIQEMISKKKLYEENLKQREEKNSCKLIYERIMEEKNRGRSSSIS
jgi:UDP-N-acetylglucosamine--N-acetylmuramyl-(pentapeptide) pyrophosphoryl-undecaprenol N-acetylglucosamine transferase